MELKVREWSCKTFAPDKLYIEDIGYTPDKIAIATRLGIPQGRDEHLPLRFVDMRYIKSTTNARIP